jgi:hypothetical protein
MENKKEIILNDSMYEGKVHEACGSNIRYKLGNKCVLCKNKKGKEQYYNNKKDEEWLKKENTRRKIWADNNRDYMRKAISEWGQKNKEYVKEKWKERRKNNPQKYRDKQNKWRSENPDKIWKYGLKARHNMSEIQFNELAKQQDNTCAICGGTEKLQRRLLVDHCHKTEKVRGLLCNSCNVGLGLFYDNVSLFQSAISYLKQEKFHILENGLYKCAICNKYPEDRELARDHCHTTNKIRGFLCFHCNTAIGWFKDNITSLQRAIEYLQKHNLEEVTLISNEKGT